jgi:hypothetical protein
MNARLCMAALGQAAPDAAIGGAGRR